MMLILLLLLLSFASHLAGDDPFLKKPQPNWRREIVESYSNGKPREILHYKPEPGGCRDIPVKQVFYYPDGAVKGEKDLPEGIEATFHPNGSIQSVTFGGSIRTFYPKGKLASISADGKLERFHENATRAELIFYQNGLPEGEILKWYDDGTLKEKKYVTRGLLHNKGAQPAFTQYHPDGSVKEVKNFFYGQPRGTHTQYHSNARPSYFVLYEKGRKEGLEQLFNEEGKVIGRGEFRIGLPIGTHTRSNKVMHYNEQGVLTQPIVEYDDAGNKIREYLPNNGDYNEWARTGQLIKEYHFVDGRFEGEQKIYDESGKLRLIATYQNGQREGERKSWHSNGNQESEGNYVAGKLHGTLREWHSNAQPRFCATYHHGKKEGIVREWNEKGEFLFEGKYHNDLPEGKHQEWYSNNKKKKVATYSKGRLHGELLSWYEDGQPKEKKKYRKGFPVDIHLEFHPMVNKISRKTQFKNGKFHGKQESFYPSGKREALMTYDNGHLHGKQVLWDQGGRILEEANYVRGNLEGEYTTITPEGQNIISHYHNHRRHGVHQVYHPIHETYGRVKALEAHYSNGLLDGEVVEYDEAGTKISSTFYRNGKKEGIATLYDHQGRMKMTGEFKNDQQEGMAYEYFPSGEVAKQVLFKNNFRHGEEKTFHPNGHLKTLYPFVEGKIHGIAKEWDKKGMLLLEAEYIHGKRNENGEVRS